MWGATLSAPPTQRSGTLPYPGRAVLLNGFSSPRGHFFNILNDPNFGSPINVLTSPQFGQSTQMLANYLGTDGQSGGLNPLYQIGGPRSIQLALKLQF